MPLTLYICITIKIICLMKLNYNEWLTLAFWEYNRYPDEELTRSCFRKPSVPCRVHTTMRNGSTTTKRTCWA